jgi:hypothetical protein
VHLTHHLLDWQSQLVQRSQQLIHKSPQLVQSTTKLVQRYRQEVQSTHKRMQKTPRQQVTNFRKIQLTRYCYQQKINKNHQHNKIMTTFNALNINTF